MAPEYPAVVDHNLFMLRIFLFILDHSLNFIIPFFTPTILQIDFCCWVVVIDNYRTSQIMNKTGFPIRDIESLHFV